MKHQFFCPRHIQGIRENESNALRSWDELMHRGINAYVACRLQDAHNYLNGAHEIALLRFECSVNTIFSNTHITKPMEFLIGMYLAGDEFDVATELVNKTKYFIQGDNPELIAQVFDDLKNCELRIENAQQKAIFSQRKLRMQKQNFSLHNQAAPPHRQEQRFH